MTRNNGFENHRLRTLIWIVRQLEHHSKKTLRELNDLYSQDEGLSAGEEIERRTFNNHKRAIFDLFGIDIQCDRRTNRYYFDNDIDGSVSHLMDNFDMMMALGRQKDLRSRIVMEDVPAGAEIRDRIIEAMKENRKIWFRFRTFDDHEEFEITGAPYALKLYQQRWYVVIRMDEYDDTDTFSLDRIIDFDILDDKFEMDPDFSVSEFFRYSFGVRVDPDRAPEVVRIKVNAVQCDYFRALPLHHSQREVEVHPHYSIFEMLLVPTIELKFKLLSYGSLVEVLEPLELREIMKVEVEILANRYNK